MIGTAQQTYGLEDGFRDHRDEFGLIFDSGILGDNSAQVVQFSRRLRGDQRFEYLRSWVLPGKPAR